MQNKQLFGSLAMLLSLSCSSTELVVGEDPPGTGGRTSGDGDGDGDGDGASTSKLPCDILAADGHSCVAAHSTVRLLRRDYDGPLYQVCKDSTTGRAHCQGDSLDILDIGATASGVADAAAQAKFCGSDVSDCAITIIYDQSGQGHHLEPAPPGSANPTPSNPVLAARLPTTVNGRDAYGVLIRPGSGYRAGCTACKQEPSSEMPIGDEPETIYMVTSYEDLIDGCCFNYGNGSVTSNNDGNGTSETVNFSLGVIWGSGTGSGPWVMADLENGLFAGWENGADHNISTNTPLERDFVTAILVGDTADKNDGKGRFALYGGNAQQLGDMPSRLTTMYDGIRPERPGYVPMQKQGGVILGIGSDHSNGAGGRFYEGAIAKGAASQTTLDALQAAIVAAKYGE